MDYAEAIGYLYGRRRLGMTYGNDRMEALLEDLGNPQRAFRTIHVVGTNGKGSTTAMLSATATALGLRTGRNTSPHLLDFRERIAVDGRWIPPGAVVDFVGGNLGLFERHEATFFEITTAMAAWHFAREGVDWAVVEAGLGGRLDATRTFHGAGTVFTGVDIEHRRILGRNRTLIAGEKLAIADPGTVLVAERMHPLIERRISVSVESAGLSRVFPGNPSGNAGLALAAAIALLGRGADEVRAAFDTAMRGLRWPGRLDLRRGDPDVLFDVSHNPQSIARLCGHLAGLGRRPAAVIGFLADKPWRRMTGMLRELVGPVVTTTPLSDRMLPASTLAREFEARGFDVRAVDSIGDAVAEGRRLAPGLLVVAGSFYVVGEAMLAAWRNGWIDRPLGEEEQIADSPPTADGACLP